MAPHSGRQDTEASKTAASKWLLPRLKRVGGEKKKMLAYHLPLTRRTL